MMILDYCRKSHGDTLFPLFGVMNPPRIQKTESTLFYQFFNKESALMLIIFFINTHNQDPKINGDLNSSLSTSR